MKVLFVVNDESVSTSIVKKYQKKYKEIISYKNVYYFNAIIKELQKNRTYDRIVISEDLDEIVNSNAYQKDKILFDKLDNISDEAVNSNGEDIPIILICNDRRNQSEEILVKLFGIGIYNAILGTDRTIDMVCELINKPRSKKEAKKYYNINSENVSYEKEKDNYVSEVEIQNVLRHFKKISGKDEEIVDSFKKIVMQYNNEQLKVIIAILPNDIKSVLEEESPEYQSIVVKKGTQSSTQKKKSTKISQGTSERLLKNESSRNLSRQVVVPTTMEHNLYKKVESGANKENEDEFEDNEIENTVEKMLEKQRKKVDKPSIKEDIKEEKVHKKRGRPKKNKENQEKQEISFLPGLDDEEDETEEKNEDIFNVENDEKKESKLLKTKVIKNKKTESNNPEGEEEDDYEESFHEENNKKKNIKLSNLSENFQDEEEDMDNEEYENEENQNSLYEEEEQDNILYEENENDEDNEDDDQIRTVDEFNYENTLEHQFQDENNNMQETNDNSEFEKSMEKYGNQVPLKDEEIDSLITGDKKIVCFVGTSKNGTSFIVNNVAQVLANKGIDTAILDTTKNRNSYYTYTNDDEELRRIAFNSIDNLIKGNANGIKINNNLTVYSGVPSKQDEIKNSKEIIETLLKKHSIVLIDCDFITPFDYFDIAQEIYLIQSFDVLTIQPLTEFLRMLQLKNVLFERKIRIILNKYLKIRGGNSKTIVKGMSKYNNEDLSLMKDLFDIDQVKVVAEIPFDEDVYIRYLESLISCEIWVNSYPKAFKQKLNNLANIIYPLLPNKNKKKEKEHSYQKSFPSDMNNTLEDMRKKY